MTDDKATGRDNRDDENNTKPESSKTPSTGPTPNDENSSEKAKQELDRQLESGEENPG